MATNALPPELQEYIEQEISRGNFASEDDLLRDAVRLHRERKLFELRKQLDAGLRDADQGEAVECADDEALARFFEQLKTGGREQLAAQDEAK